MRQKGNPKSAAYYIEFDKEVDDFKDEALPPLDAIIKIDEDLKYYNWPGPIKRRKGIYRVVEEYTDFFRCKKIGPSPFIDSYNITDSFQKNEFKKGLFTFTIIEEKDLSKYMDKII